MYILFAILSILLFAGATVLTKSGIRNGDSNAGVVITTSTILVYSIVMLLISGGFNEINTISPMSWLSILISGVSYALFILFCFKSLTAGNISDIAPICTCNIVIYRVFYYLFTGNIPSVYSIVALSLILIGTLFMTIKKGNGKKGKRWFLSAWISVGFLAFSEIIKLILGVPVLRNHLSNSISAVISIAFALLVIILQSKKGAFGTLHTKNVVFLILAGLAICGSWFSFNYASSIEPANVMINTEVIDKFSVIAVIGAGCLFLRERISARSAAGLILITAGLIVNIF